jgi:DNA-binding NtrC family response regulator
MSSVLLVDQEKSLSEILRDMLQEAGYDVTVCTDASWALNMLRVATASVVVILSHGGLSQEWEHMLAAAAELPRHAYLVLSTRPEEAPAQWNPHTQAYVPVVPMPFDMDVLLAQVAEAVVRLQSVPSRPSDS